MSENTRIAEFRRSLKTDLYLPTDIIPWDAIENEINTVENAGTIYYLQEIATYDAWTANNLAHVLSRAPHLVETFRALLALPLDVSFNGREFPRRGNKIDTDWETIAQLLIDLGIAKILTPTSNIKDFLRIAAVAEDAMQRRFRLTDRLNKQILSRINAVIQHVNNNHRSELRMLNVREFPTQARNKVESVISVDGVPTIAIVYILSNNIRW